MMRHSDVVYIMGLRHIWVDGRLVRDNRTGRPSYAGPFGEPTVLIRVPVSLVPDLKIKMDELRQREEELRQKLREDVFYTTPGFKWDDLPSECLVQRFNFPTEDLINE